jgi:ribonuclease P protein component
VNRPYLRFESLSVRDVRSTVGMPPRDLKFPKSRRLTRPAEFERVKNHGRAEHGRLLVVGVLRVDGSERFRAGFITSRALGPAVVRNRVRRRLREIVRKHQREITNSTWIVTIARPSAPRANYEQLEAEWLRLAERASILSA